MLVVARWCRQTSSSDRQEREEKSREIGDLHLRVAVGVVLASRADFNRAEHPRGLMRPRNRGHRSAAAAWVMMARADRGSGRVSV